METTEIKFGSEEFGGLYIENKDCRIYFEAIHFILSGRHDPILMAHLVQLQELLRHSFDNKYGQTLHLKPLSDCLGKNLDCRE